ncbi:hypothetical protein IscW_ISCW017436 [Ixodes scapularis]|uniref:Uncharacterized protein n=1 Tax=Ixodes scapularis TaxID=6945 RepID=B7PC81_IXOSC|nr:hypothetical protein IscW_ISCW017436 [Ixodes scapularis]|eukprot:XP_002409489.1 hypothetical protein IscW_ISCW017436 [Ixodes scapularis]
MSVHKHAVGAVVVGGPRRRRLWPHRSRRQTPSRVGPGTLLLRPAAPRRKSLHRRQQLLDYGRVRGDFVDERVAMGQKLELHVALAQQVLVLVQPLFRSGQLRFQLRDSAVLGVANVSNPGLHRFVLLDERFGLFLDRAFEFSHLDMKQLQVVVGFLNAAPGWARTNLGLEHGRPPGPGL